MAFCRLRAQRRFLQAVLAMIAMAGVVPARSQELPEYRLKAAFIYNVAAYTEWPSEVGDTLKLCIFGADPFGADIEPLNDKMVGARRVVVQRNRWHESLVNCQLVFVTGSAIAQLPLVLEVVRGLPVLTVADSPGAARRGAVLNMSIEAGRISFEANLAAARLARLSLSSKLLRLATGVIP